MALTTTQRGYGSKHQKLRAATVNQAYGTPCVRCGWIMHPGQSIQLDHNGTRTGYLGYSHELCNKKAGGRKGALIMHARRRMRKMISRQW